MNDLKESHSLSNLKIGKIQLTPLNSKMKKYNNKIFKFSVFCNQKNFPSDFFENKKKENDSYKFLKNCEIKIIDLQKEYDEDKEIIDMLNGKSKF